VTHSDGNASGGLINREKDNWFTKLCFYFKDH
jgi:hypothetical protein